MKHRLQITLEDAANELLNQQENKSKYIEDLILKQDTSDLTTEIKRLSMLVDGQVNDIQNIIGAINTIKQNIANHQANSSVSQPATNSNNRSEAFVPRPPDPDTGYPCCTKQTPCKHWVWDNSMPAWVNSLTGKTKEIM